MKAKNDKVIIRELEFDDLPAVFHLGETLFTAGKWPVLYRHWDEYEVLERFLSDNEYCFVAEREEKIVGFAIGTLIRKSKGSWTYGYLIWLGIDQKFQGKGIGKNLLNRLTRRLIENGAKMMMVDTASDNTQAIEFFKKKGFDNIDPHVYLTKNLLDNPYYKTLKKRGVI